MTDFESLQHYLRKFANDRDWQQFHSPKNLSMALMVEAGELLEHFQWLSEEQSQQLTCEQLSAVSDEVVDVLLYTLRLADVLNIPLEDALARKTKANEQKYPIEKVKGCSKKYNQYE